MSEEEKEAIEYFKNEILDLKKTIVGFEKEIEDKQWLKKQVGELNRDILMREILLNYIDKLEKENNKYIEEQNNVTIMETQYFKDKYISKDTIREILKINTIESISCDNNYKEPLLHLRKEIYDLIGVKNESSNRRTGK